MIAICTQVFQMCDSNTTKLKVIQGRVPLAAKHKTTQEQLGLVERSKRVKAADLCPRAAADRGSVGLNNGGICQFRHTLLESPEHHVKEGGLPIINLMWQLLFLESGGDGLQVIRCPYFFIVYFAISLRILGARSYWNIETFHFLKVETCWSQRLKVECWTKVYTGTARLGSRECLSELWRIAIQCNNCSQLWICLDLQYRSILYNRLVFLAVVGQSGRSNWVQSGIKKASAQPKVWAILFRCFIANP